MSRTVLSTDSGRIAEIGRAAEIEVPFSRPEELARDDTPTVDVVRHALRWLDIEQDYVPEVVVILQPTAPLRTAEDIDRTIGLLETTGADSVVSVSEVPGHFSPGWQLVIEDDELRLTNGRSLSQIVTRRQELSATYYRNGAVYSLWRKTLESGGSLYGRRCIPYFMPRDRSLNIDDELDLCLADALVRRSEQSRGPRHAGQTPWQQKNLTGWPHSMNVEAHRRIAEKCDVLFVLSSPFHVRNYVTSGVVSELAERGLSVAVATHQASISLVASQVQKDVHLVPIDGVLPTESRRRHLRLLRIASFVHRRSRAEYRFKTRWQAGKLGLDLAATLLSHLTDGVSDSEQVAEKVLAALSPRKEALDMMSSLGPRLVIRPTTISETEDFELVQSAYKLGVPILMCEGSWDNFTSKGAIWPPPQLVLVWGEYSRQQAEESHGLSDGVVEVTGPPHFDVYGDPAALASRGEWFALHDLDPSKRMILFGGTTVGKFSDESFVVKLLSRWIDSGTLPPSYIWYRAHPRTRVRAEQEGISSIPHVVVDPGVGEEDSLPQGNWSVHPMDAVQRANALNASDVLVSAFSTIIIEAALLGKPSVIVGFSDSDGPARPTIFPNLDFGHVKYLLRSEWIRGTTDKEQLLACLHQFLSPKSESQRDELRRFGLTIANCGDGMGRRRIEDSIQRMASGVRSGGVGARGGVTV